MIELSLKDWAPFAAKTNKREMQRWLKLVASESGKIFRNMKHHPPASKKGQYPAVRTGRLRASITSEVRGTNVVVASHMPYSGYLRYGTKRMARRKMSDNALQEGIKAAKKMSGHFAGWTRGKGSGFTPDK